MLSLSNSPYFFESGLSLWLFGIFLLIFYIASLVIVPWTIVSIPANYFTSEYRKKTPKTSQHPIIRLFVIAGKNFLGGLLVVMGIAMLVLPGQGILTILMGIVMLNFPGKYKIERWVIQKKPILFSANWIRKKWGKSTLRFD